MTTPLRSLLLGFGIDVSGKGKLDAVDGTVDSILKKVTQLGAGLASVFIVKQIAGFITDTIDAGSALKLTSERLGVTVDELERYRFATNQNGISTENADRALQMFNRQLGESELGSKAATKGIAQLGSGMSAAQLSALPLQDLLGQIADKFAGMTDKSAKTQLAMKLFGRAGAALIPMLDQGAAGMKQLNDEFDALGGGIGGDLATKMLDAQRETKKLDFVWGVLKARLVGDILPGVTKFVLLLAKVATGLEWLQKHTYIAQTALIALGAAALVAFAPFLIAMAPVLALFTSLYLVFDDIYTLFAGGDSVIGAFLNNILGKDGASKLIRTIKEDFYAFVDWLKGDGLAGVAAFGRGLRGEFLSVRPILEDLLHKIQEVLSFIGRITGVKPPGGALTPGEQKAVEQITGDEKASTADLLKQQEDKHPVANFFTDLASRLGVNVNGETLPDGFKAVPRITPSTIPLPNASYEPGQSSNADASYDPNSSQGPKVHIENLHVTVAPGSSGTVDDAIHEQVQSVQNSSPVVP